MRRKEKEITDPAAIDSILRAAKWATLALNRGNEPYAVALSMGYDPDSKALYFHCAMEGQKIDFIRSNPNACACIVEDLGYRQGDCSHAYRSVVVRGRATIVEDVGQKRRALEVLIGHLEQDPQSAKKKHIPPDDVIAKVGIIRLSIEEMTAKGS